MSENKVTITINGRPVSKKNSRIPIRSGKRIMNIPSNAYRKFEKEALSQLTAHKARFEGHVNIHYEFQLKGKLWVDVDNAMGGINDILEKARIIDNDKNIKSGSFALYGGFKDFQTIVTITSTNGKN